MSKCARCGKHGLFMKVNIHTGLCNDCQKQFELEKSAPPVPAAPVEKSIEIPNVYIGNNMKFLKTNQFEDVELIPPDNLPDFSKIHCCDNVSFSVSGDSIVAKRLSSVIGVVGDSSIARSISKSLTDNLPVFSQILGYDDETGEIHIVIAFYRIVDYDYTEYKQDRDSSLDNEIVGYF